MQRDFKNAFYMLYWKLAFDYLKVPYLSLLVEF